MPRGDIGTAADRGGSSSRAGAGPGTDDWRLRPVRALLRKERAVLRLRYRAGLALVFILGALQTIRSDEAYLWLGILLAGALTLTGPVIEWRLDADRLIASLPVRRRSIVGVRYLVAAAAVGLAWAVWSIAGAILGPVLADGLPAPRIWADLPGVLTFLGLSGLLIGTLLPLYFAAGLGRAAILFPPAALVLVVGSGWGATLIAADPATLTAGAGAALNPPGAAVRRAADSLVGTVGDAGAALIWVGLLLAFLALSARVSLVTFRRREL